jgi:hypothetical protein
VPMRQGLDRGLGTRGFAHAAASGFEANP